MAVQHLCEIIIRPHQRLGNQQWEWCARIASGPEQSGIAESARLAVDEGLRHIEALLRQMPGCIKAQRDGLKEVLP